MVTHPQDSFYLFLKWIPTKKKYWKNTSDNDDDDVLIFECIKCNRTNMRHRPLDADAIKTNYIGFSWEWLYLLLDSAQCKFQYSMGLRRWTDNSSDESSSSVSRLNMKDSQVSLSSICQIEMVQRWCIKHNINNHNNRALCFFSYSRERGHECVCASRHMDTTIFYVNLNHRVLEVGGL